MKLETKLHENKRWNFSRLNTGAIIYQVVRSYYWFITEAISHTRARCDCNQTDVDYRVLGPVHTAFGFVFGKNSRRKIILLQRRRRFWKVPFSNCFSFTLKRKASVLKSSGLKSVFKNLRFRDGLVWTVALTVQIKLRLQISQAQCCRRLWSLYVATLVVGTQSNKKRKCFNTKYILCPNRAYWHSPWHD